METVQKRLESLEGIVHDLTGAVDELRHEKRYVERQFGLWRGLAYGLMLTGLLVMPMRAGITQTSVTALNKFLAHLTVDGPGTNGTDIHIRGANLHIENGTGKTNSRATYTYTDPNDRKTYTFGLGNLIVGYNELRKDGETDFRQGSHNIVVGWHNSFQD